MADLGSRFEEMQAKCVEYADELMDARAKIKHLNDQIADQGVRFGQLSQQHEGLKSDNQIQSENLQIKNRVAQTLQLDYDTISFKFNEQEALANQLRSENQQMTKVLNKKLEEIEQLNQALATKESQMQLLSKAKDQKDKHCSILVGQKEKLMQQLDQLSNKSAKPDL